MLKVMTFNLRVDTVADGANRFFRRTDRVLDTIRNEAADLIGFQEATDAMRVFLRENLTGYTVIGCGGYEKFNGAGNPIAFRSDRFELTHFETRWLSFTPEIPGSTYGGDQSKYPRFYHLSKLSDLKSGKEIVFINTHADHVGENARLAASGQLLDVVGGVLPAGVILSGDFNALPESESIRRLAESPFPGFRDVTGGIPSSFHGWANTPQGKYDYIFSNLPCLECHAVEDIPVNGVYISDHNPVVASVLE